VKHIDFVGRGIGVRENRRHPDQAEEQRCLGDVH